MKPELDADDSDFRRCQEVPTRIVAGRANPVPERHA